MLLCRGEHVDRPDHVDLRVLARPFDRSADIGLRGQVEDRIGPEGGEYVTERLADVALDELDSRRHVLAAAAMEVVDSEKCGRTSYPDCSVQR